MEDTLLSLTNIKEDSVTPLTNVKENHIIPLKKEKMLTWMISWRIKLALKILEIIIWFHICLMPI